MDYQFDDSLDDWQLVRDVLSPGNLLIVPFSKEPDSVEQQLLELSFVSSRKEYWQVFVAVMCYDGLGLGSARTTLTRIPFYPHLSGEYSPSALSHRLQQEDKFLEFVASRFDFDSISFLGAALTLHQKAASFVNTASSFAGGVEIIKECAIDFPIPPHTQADRLSCVRSRISTLRKQASVASYAL